MPRMARFLLSSLLARKRILDKGTKFDAGKEMDGSSQYGPYAFLPYIEAPSSGDVSSSTTSNSDSPAIEFISTVKHTSSWTYCGPVFRADEFTLPHSFHKWASVTVSHPSKLLDRLTQLLVFLQSFLLQAGIKHYWLTIRATKPTLDYDTPRWHVDDDFFAPDFGRLVRNKESGDKIEKRRKGWKLATALLGPPTLFLRENEAALEVLRKTKAHKRASHQHECTSIRCLGCSTYADSVRKSLATSLEGHAVESPRSSELAFFRLGDYEGAVHSEPVCNVDRIFVNVVPGSEQQLRALMEQWGMEFPRAWCMGVPGGIVLSDECATFLKRTALDT